MFILGNNEALKKLFRKRFKQCRKIVKRIRKKKRKEIINYQYIEIRLKKYQEQQKKENEILQATKSMVQKFQE